MHFLQQLLLPVHSNRLLVCLSAVGTGGPVASSMGLSHRRVHSYRQFDEPIN